MPARRGAGVSPRVSATARRRRAPEMDAILARERLDGRAQAALRSGRSRSLPDGAMIAREGRAFALRGDALLPWAFDGYGAPQPRPARRRARRADAAFDRAPRSPPATGRAGPIARLDAPAAMRAHFSASASAGEARMIRSIADRLRRPRRVGVCSPSPATCSANGRATDGKGKVRFSPCGGAVCGAVTWVKDPERPRQGRAARLLRHEAGGRRTPGPARPSIPRTAAPIRAR